MKGYLIRSRANDIENGKKKKKKKKKKFFCNLETNNFTSKVINVKRRMVKS